MQYTIYGISGQILLLVHQPEELRYCIVIWQAIVSHTTDETSFFTAKSRNSMEFLLISQALWFFFGESHIPFWQEDHRFTIHLAATATQNYYNSSGVVSRGGNSPGRFLAQATNRTTTCIYLSHFGWNLRSWYCHIGFNFPVILGLCGVLWLLIGVRNNSMYPSCLEKELLSRSR